MTTAGFTADFTGVDAGSKSLAGGTYIANIFKATMGEITSEQSKNKGQPKVSVEFKVHVPGSENARSVFQTYTFTPQGMPYTKQPLLAAGVKEDELSGKVDGKKLIQMSERIVGQEVAVKVRQKHDPNNSPFDDDKTNSVQAVYGKKSPQADTARSAGNSNRDPLAP